MDRETTGSRIAGNEHLLLIGYGKWTEEVTNRVQIIQYPTGVEPQSCSLA